MTREQLRTLLNDVAAGRESAQAALDRMSWTPVETVGDDHVFARLDHHRGLRNGVPEVVFGEGKTTKQIVEICARLAAHGSGFLATRVSDDARAELQRTFVGVQLNDLARTAYLPGPATPAPNAAVILVASAGTGDLPVAEEAAVTATALGNTVERLYDVGVAGLHRLLNESTVLQRAAVVIVVAGMEGALPSVVGGLIRAPVIAVPTSVGYGASFGGIAALLGMLNSCASGITVVNIDNGFGAACAATRIAQTLIPQA
ncbi:MAG: nickel pincer cofactor biosynthesis protein LarB [Longimicrobiales bacterium]